MNEENKRACLRLMALKDESLTPEARYFLIRMMYIYDSRVANLESLKSNRDLGVSHSDIRNAVSQLKRCGYLELASEQTEPPAHRGRPRQGFRVKPRWWDDWSSASSESLFGQVRYAHLIHKFLFEVAKGKSDLVNQNAPILALAGQKKTKMDQAERNAFSSSMNALKKNSLTPANRILLATLYLRADECGVVRGLGSADLQRLTGMGRERLDDQFDKLKELGFLWVRVAGLTGVHAIGQVKSIFYLNPFNQPVGGKYHLIHLLCDSDSIAPDTVRLPLQAIRKYGEELSGSYKGTGSKEHEDVRFIHYLQHKFCEYASDLMTKYWASLDGATIPNDEDLKLKISNEVYPKHLRDSKSIDSVESSTKKVEVELIYSFVLRIAYFYKRFIVETLKNYESTSLILSELSYVIIPVQPIVDSKIIHSQKYRWAVLIKSDRPVFIQSVLQMEMPYAYSEVSGDTLKFSQLVDVVKFFRDPNKQSRLTFRESV